MFCLSLEDGFKRAFAVLPCPLICWLIFFSLAHKAIQFMELLKWAGVGYNISLYVLRFTLCLFFLFFVISGNINESRLFLRCAYRRKTTLHVSVH